MDEKYIFISYAHKDSDTVVPIIKALSEKYNVWYDDGIEIGSEWPEYIATKLINSRVVIAFMSKNALNSINCKREVNYAINKNKDVIIVYIESVELTPGIEMQLGVIQAVHYYKFSNKKLFIDSLFSAGILKECRKRTISTKSKKDNSEYEEKIQKSRVGHLEDQETKLSFLVEDAVQSVSIANAEHDDLWTDNMSTSSFLDLLSYQKPDDNSIVKIKEEIKSSLDVIMDTLKRFNVKAKIADIQRGPTVTRYEIVPEAGVRVKSIANLADDIALGLATEGIRIECPIPGKSAVGIEVPNKITSIVYLKELIAHKKFKEAKSVLTVALGKSVSGDVEYVDIEKTPHLLVAGSTGMGKSTCINSMLISLLYKSRPDEVRLILIDPKRVEFSDFNGLPHLLVPVVTEPKKSLGALQWLVSEMERRFEIFEGAGARNLGEYNDKIDSGLEGEKMARIVIVIDELADLKMTVPEAEGCIVHLAQKARAAGIHIIIGTQRPSVDVITGLIKSNIPSRISFRVPSQVDSRTVLDEVGAEKLVYRGDMLVKIVGTLRPVRLQGSLVTASEVQNVISFIKENSSENYDESVMQQIDNNVAKLEKMEHDEDERENIDDKFCSALILAVEMGKISSSLLMRKLGLGFQRASRIIDQMEECGYIGKPNGSKPREVFVTEEEIKKIIGKTNIE